jgi:hypothetical protein
MNRNCRNVLLPERLRIGCSHPVDVHPGNGKFHGCGFHFDKLDQLWISVADSYFGLGQAESVHVHHRNHPLVRIAKLSDIRSRTYLALFFTTECNELEGMASSHARDSLVRLGNRLAPLQLSTTPSPGAARVDTVKQERNTHGIQPP